MRTVKLNEYLDEPHCVNFYINDNEGNSLIRIGLEAEVNRQPISDDNMITFEIIDTTVSSILESVNLIKYFDKNADVINKAYFFKNVENYQNYHIWLNCTYKPKWQKALGDDFFKTVIDYIKNDIYLFCSACDNTTAYMEINGGNKRINIK